MRETSIKQRMCLLSGLLLFIFLWQSSPGHGTEIHQMSKVGPAVVAYCDLVTNPDRYDGKEVAIRATYRYGFEWQELFCLECRKLGRTWLEFDDNLTRQSRTELKKWPKDQGTVNAVFTGTFSKGTYGDGGYRFQLRVKVISGSKVISKSGRDPERLSPAARKRVCSGG